MREEAQFWLFHSTSILDFFSKLNEVNKEAGKLEVKVVAFLLDRKLEVVLNNKLYPNVELKFDKLNPEEELYYLTIKNTWEKRKRSKRDIPKLSRTRGSIHLFHLCQDEKIQPHFNKLL